MFKRNKMSTKDVASVVDGLKKIYEKKIKPVEELYRFADFHSPLMRESDFDAKPMVLLLGQYSTGKTTFIEYMLQKHFPGSHIGPEPTTDRFIAVMHGTEERVTPGNALAVQSDKPFRGLDIFGTGFLSKFQSAELNAPLLESMIFIDTPGVLSGEKQRLGRAYDFPKVCGWFAERADMILLLFDAHKLDISDEFKSVIESLKGHDEKIRVVLNKADMINSQQLMRVYGSLMWSLGKVIQAPEVVRVYVGSFWDQPYQNEEFRKLFEAEQGDLMNDLSTLPGNGTIRKVNELVKRARLVKVHSIILGHLKEEMPSVFGKGSKQQELIANLSEEFVKLQRKYKIPAGDFPDIKKYQEILKLYDFSKLPKYNPKLIEQMDEVLSRDLTELLSRFPKEGDAKIPGALSGNPADDPNLWVLSEKNKARHEQAFKSAGPEDGKLSGAAAKNILLGTGLNNDTLKRIWYLADIDKDGHLDLDEFFVAMHLAEVCQKNIPLPATLPVTMIPSGKLDSPF